MKNFLLAIVMIAAFDCTAQDISIAKKDIYTSKGSHGLSLTGNVSASYSSLWGQNYRTFNQSGRLSYEYFVANGLSIGADLYGSVSYQKFSQSQSVNLGLDAGIHSRYYFSIGKGIPYRWLFVEANYRTSKNAVNPITGEHSNYGVLGAKVGANIQVRKNWFVEGNIGYNQSLNKLENWGGFSSSLGLTYRFPHSKAK